MKNSLTRQIKNLLLICFSSFSSLFISAQTHPGGINGASVWLRADNGVTATGTNVSAWTNQSGAPNFNGTGNPQLTAGHVNFNPAITFSGTNYLTSTSNVLPANSAYTKFVVFKFDATTANNIISSGSGGNNAFYGGNTTTNLYIFHNGNILTATNAVSNARYYLGVAGFSSGVAAGTFINVDGTTTITTNSSASYAASTMQLGAYVNANNLNGRIAEVIVYPSALGNNSASTRQIESYLGIKYGITLAHDYLSSDGTTTYAISGFANNIAGIGRDDNSALHQKQSKSLNTTTSQVVMASGSIAATNQANANTITTDKQFLVWGNDNGSITSTTTLAGWTNVDTRLVRIWKLQNTGSFNQQVTVYFPTSSLNTLPGSSPHLIYNTSSTLAGGGTEIAAGSTATIGGVAHTGFTVTFPTTGTLYFSFASKTINPGNVLGAAVWLRGDAGVNTTGTNVTGWINQVNAANSFTATANPQFNASSVNFQPGVVFNGSNYLTSTSTVLSANSPYTKFVVFKNQGATSSNIVSSGSGGTNAFIYSAPSSVALWHSGPILTSPAGSITTTRYHLAMGGFTQSLTNGTYVNVDGVTTTPITSNTTYTAATMQLGAHNNTASLNGSIAEVIAYPSSLGNTTIPAQQIESYLGIKYGITLGHNYLASDGLTNVYNVSSFGNNIAGIGRDDNTALYQKQGTSTNTDGQVVMALESVAATNIDNTNTITSDKQFLIWGDDNGSSTSTTTLAGWTNVDIRLVRIWKLQNSGSFNQQVMVYFPVTNLNALPGTNPNLIYNTSSTLAGGGTEVPATVTTTIGSVTYKGFTLTFPTTGTLYFSFASKTINPGNVPGAAVWLRGDAGVNTTGTNVTDWINQVNAANSFTATANPQFATSSVNFQPGVAFSGSNYLTSASTVLPANSPYTKFVVFKNEGSTSSNIVSSGPGGTNAFIFAAPSSVALWHGGIILSSPAGSITTTRYHLAMGGFTQNQANGTYVNVDGVTSPAINSNTTYAASTMQLGGHINTPSLDGRIAEVIAYPSSLGNATIPAQQIESYLGIKYGITLGHNYLASDGLTNVYNVSSFGSNIAGIGRDDNTALYQKQSISTNTGSQVVMALGSVAATNTDNTNTITTDKQFLVWGDDNASITATVAVAGFATVNNRFTRIWKLQNTGSFNQQVTVYFPTSSLNILANTTKYLIYNTSSILTGPGTEVAASATTVINGTAYTGFVVTFTTDPVLYFSFASKAINPGNVPAPAVWVRADAGVNTSGATISSWINQSNISNNLTATGNPQLTPSLVNFNPSVLFDGSDYFTSAANVPSAANSNYTKFIVFRAVTGTNNLLSSSTGGPSWAMFTPDQRLYMRHNNVDVAITGVNTINPGRQYLGSQVFSSGTANGTMIKLNGVVSAGPVTSNVGYSVGLLQVGAHFNGFFIGAGGNIAEAIVYTSALNSTQIQQVESYLGLKYGLTLGADYFASDGSIIYTASGYGTNIAGIGRDDNGGLDQRQSQSINPGSQVVMAAGSIAASNEENATAIAADKQFLIWGDNDAPGYNYNVGILQKRLTTTWQLRNTGSFNQAVTVYYPVTGLYGLGDAPMLIYGTLASLDDGTATQVNVGTDVMINGEPYRSFTVTFPVTSVLYFSFAGAIVPEICGNGIDDDLDEYIDELDAGCTPIPSCVAPAPPLTNFGIKQDWVTTSGAVLACSVSPTVADLDGDGMPEILTVRAGGVGITYFEGNGSNAAKNTIDYNIQLPVRVGQSTMQTAVADIDRDGVPEVIVVGDDRFVYVFNNVSGSTSVYKYRSEETVATRFENGSPRVVDINEDGIPEIIVGLDVFQFNFGENRLVKVVRGSATAPFGRDGVPTAGSEWGNDVVVVDILASNPGKEIVAGSQVYGVNLTTGVTTVLANLNTIDPSVPANDDGPTAVADLDNDGSLDIAYPNGTQIIAWNPSGGVLKLKLNYVNGGQPYRGLPAIANVYNEQALDGAPSNLPEIIFTSATRLHAFNLNKLTGSVWSLVTTDNSGQTGLTAFDLNGDGVQEIIYNDETQIRVINGNTAAPANVATFASGTATWMEHPVVVDVDNDGGAEFVCVSGAAVAFQGALRVFGPANGTSPWQDTRKLWNGRGYRPKAIIDDLTVPVKEQEITVQYPPGSGKYPIDVFNCQIDARLLDPDIAPVSDMFTSSLSVANSEIACSFTPASAALTYTIFNNGSVAAPAGTPIRFYVGDPTAAGSTRLSATDALDDNLAVGSSVTRSVTLNLSAFTPPYTVYAVANDDGSDPVPISLPIASTNVKECDYTNNIGSVLVSPLPSDFGNLTASWPIANASIIGSNAAWLGINTPTSECANNVNDSSDGLFMTSGATGGNGSNANPWQVSGSGTVCDFTLTVNGNGTPKPVYWAVWYDANANGIFTDAIDVFLTGSLVHGSPVSTNFSITVPGSGGSFTGVIRVVATATDPGFTQAMNGTGTFSNGEVEDYFINYARALPVKLERFVVSATGRCTAGLEWTTSLEDNSDSYELQRSTNGIDFYPLGRIKSKNSPTGSQYTYTDHDAPDGTSYYRLMIVDINGMYEYSWIVKAVVTCNSTDIRLRPNPVRSTTTITGLQSGDGIRLLSNDGRTLMEKIAGGAMENIDLRFLPQGIYLVQIWRNGVIVGKLKVIKM